jgi:drug/metabolite transporter (DMT)-like permease
MLLTMGLQRETASRGTLAVYSKIIFATMFERILFHTLPSYLSVVGTLMIVVSALYIVVCSYPFHITCTVRSLINEI